MKLHIFTDGGSRGNPGHSGIGVYITNSEGIPLEQRYKYVGIKTNNESEYLGAYYGIRRGIEIGASSIHLHMDSKLVISQLSGKWKIKNEKLREIYEDILKMVNEHKIEVFYKWIPREQNKDADRLSNKAMDTKK